MHSLPVLREAAESALDGDDAEFRSIVDPASVLELVDIAERSWSDDEHVALAKLLDELTDFIRRAPTSPEREDLLQRSKMLRGVLEI